MSNTDTSSSAKTRMIGNRTLALFHKKNAAYKEASLPANFSASSHTARVAGGFVGPCCTVRTCSPPGAITNAIFTDYGNAEPPYEAYNFYFIVTWDAVPGISYSITSEYSVPPLEGYPGDDLPVIVGPGLAHIYSKDLNSANVHTFTIIASNTCGSTQTTTTGQPCFLAGSLVQMADGSVKAIEDVAVGDSVLGAFGETNTVLALHRPLLGKNLMCRINNEHSTTNHHPHISVDRKFYCGNPALVSSGTYGRVHKVIDANGEIVDRMLYGLAPERILQLEVGVELKTVDGSRVTESLDLYSLPEDTQLYNLVIGGSHTYHVDGYAVTGWPREDDFDYDTWTKKQ